MRIIDLSPENCQHSCTGCGVTFGPDVNSCPLQVFDGWEFGKDIQDKEDWDTLEMRRKGEFRSYQCINR